MNVRTALMERNAYLDIKELYEPMKIMYDSLLATGDDSVSAGRGGGGAEGGPLINPRLWGKIVTLPRQ